MSGKLDQISSQIDGLKKEIQNNNKNKDAKTQLKELQARYDDLAKQVNKSSDTKSSDTGTIRKDLRKDASELEDVYKDLESDI